MKILITIYSLTPYEKTHNHESSGIPFKNVENNEIRQKL